MKTTEGKTLPESALRTLAKSWALGRILIEHAKASATPPGEQDFSEREELVIKLVELFPGCVTETTLVKVFDLHYSQAGQIVERLSKRDILEKKVGKGVPLKLTKAGEIAAKEIELVRGYRFGYACEILNETELQQYAAIMEKMFQASFQQVEERIFGKPPRGSRLRSP
jgi:predicted transcriptional regulator